MENNLVNHILAMADDAYLIGHPEWMEIVKEAQKIKDNEKSTTPTVTESIKILEKITGKKVVLEKCLSESIESRYEYVIWGIPAKKTDEEVLMSKFDGKNITDIKVAEKLKKILEQKYNCINCRIQTIDLDKDDISNDWKNVVK